jgi:hypothetical protein
MSPPTYPNTLPKPAHLEVRSSAKRPEASPTDKRPAGPAVRRLYWAVVAVGTLITWLVAA